MARKKKSKYTLLKGTIIAGILLGIFFKAQEFFRTKTLYCGIFFPKGCEKDFLLYLKDLGITVLITTIATLVIVYGGLYVIKYIIATSKNIKLKDIKSIFKSDSKTTNKPKEKKESKPKNSNKDLTEEKNPHEPDEIIKI